MTPTLTRERTVTGRICLADAADGRDALRLTCPGPHTADWSERAFADVVTLHCDGKNVWATHSFHTCARRLDFDAINVELFDRLYAESGEPGFGAEVRRLNQEVCLPRLLGRVEHDHSAGLLPEIRRYSAEYVDGTGSWWTDWCPSCHHRSGFAAEFDLHRLRIWCGACGHSWTETYEGGFHAPRLTGPRTVRGEQAAGDLARDLLTAAGR
jgi:hypothetical protein